MKRLLSIFLAVLLMAASCTVAFSANETEVVINATDANNFYGNSLNNGTNTLETSDDGAVVLRAGTEWVSYDLSSVTPGLYNLNLNYSATREPVNPKNPTNNTGLFYNIYMNSTLISKFNINSTGDLTKYTSSDIGVVEVKEGSTLKILNCGRYTTRLKEIKLTPASEGQEPCYDIKQYGENSTISDANGSLVITNNTDYYDTGAAAFDNTSLVDGSNGYRIHNANEWTRYDVKGMRAGTYKISINAGARNTTCKFTLYMNNENSYDNTNAIVSANMEISGLTTPGLNEMGEVYIPAGMEYLWVKTTGDASYWDYVNFEFLYADDRSPVEDVTLANYFTDASKNKNTGEALVHATDSADFRTGDFYDKNGANDIHILYTRDGVDFVYLQQSEWVKYDLSLSAGVYDVTVNFDTRYASSYIDVLFLDANGTVVGSKTIEYTSGGSGFNKNLTATLKGVDLDRTVTDVVIKAKTGICAFMSLSCAATLGAEISFTSDEAGENKIDEIGNAKEVYAQIKLKNSNVIDTVTVIVAVYNGMELKEMIALEDISVVKGETVPKTYKVNVESGNKVKIFVWEDVTTTLAPICGSKEIE